MRDVAATKSARTPAALLEWSCREDAIALPSVDKIKAIHIYDFDNTLFKSPLPSPKLWKGETIGMLSSMGVISGDGWWHDNRILAATGMGVEKEEPRAWAGWWNEQIVELMQLSMEQDDALTVLLTGRSEVGYKDLINKMLRSKGLKCDLVLLKPRNGRGPQGAPFTSTLTFKEEVLRQIMETYLQALEIRVYEDRPKHVQRFREFFMDYNKIQNGIGCRKSVRDPIKAEVVYVVDADTTLDPVVEVALVQKIINDHNETARPGKRLILKKHVFYTGYLINAQDTEKLLALVDIPDEPMDMKYLANSIMISPRSATNALLDKVGGMGNKLLWQVCGIACWADKIWAANVKTVPANSLYFTEKPPQVVLAHRKSARPFEAEKIQNWQPVTEDKALIFETTVGEKVLLSIEAENNVHDDVAGTYSNGNNKRKYKDDDHPRNNGNPYGNAGNRGRGEYHHTRGGVRGRGNSRGDSQYRGRGRGRDDRNDRGRGGRGRGGGGGGSHYRSLDDPGQQDGGARYDDHYLVPVTYSRGNQRDRGGSYAQERSHQQQYDNHQPYS